MVSGSKLLKGFLPREPLVLGSLYSSASPFESGGWKEFVSPQTYEEEERDGEGQGEEDGEGEGRGGGGRNPVKDSTKPNEQMRNGGE